LSAAAAVAIVLIVLGVFGAAAAYQAGYFNPSPPSQNGCSLYAKVTLADGNPTLSYIYVQRLYPENSPTLLSADLPASASYEYVGSLEQAGTYLIVVRYGAFDSSRTYALHVGANYLDFVLTNSGGWNPPAPSPSPGPGYYSPGPSPGWNPPPPS
jgi:hypothetical protein